jgi:hypothetical protein
MRRQAAIAFLSSIFMYPACAQPLCDRPEKPSCVPLLIEAEDEAEFDMCQGEIMTFKSRMKEYVDCLRSEEDDAIKELNSAVDEWNECASGLTCQMRR